MKNNKAPETIIHDRYNVYDDNMMSVWKDRFIYRRGLKESFPSISLVNFGTETDIFSTVERKYTVSGFLSYLDNIVAGYIKWAKSKMIDKNGCDIFTEENWSDVSNWCKGVIGEYFYISVLNDIKCLNIPVNGSCNEVIRYDFREISPIPSNEDNGVDFIGFANDVPCVFQVKTWSDFKKPAPRGIYIEAYGQGCAANYINQNDDHNTFLCWFASEGNGLMSINNDEAFNDRVVCIGSSALKEAINERNKYFWDDFYDSLKYIKEEN